METPEWAVPEIDLDRPSAARVYDYLLGGSHNVRADREFAEQMLKLAPEAAEAAHANRSFLRRTVHALTQVGIRQFLDLGSGIPTRGNVHEIAQKYAPDSSIVYVDIDPIAVAHGSQILSDDPRCAAVQGDLRKPLHILEHPRVREILDFDQPIGVLVCAVLHFIPDADDPHGAVALLRDAVVPGSHLVLSHASWPPAATDQVMQAREAYDQTRTSLILRGADEIAAFAGDWRILEPGVVTVAQWRPEEGAPQSSARTDKLPALAAVAVKENTAVVKEDS
jgi:SAM-dependent methyltransferase